MTVADNKLSLQNLNRRNLYNFFRREKMWKIIIVVGLGACLIVFAFMVCNSMDSSIPNAIPEPKKSGPTKSQAQKSFAGAKPQTTKTRRRREPEPKPAKPPIFREGQTFKIGYTSYCVLKSMWSGILKAGKSLDDLPDAMFLFVTITVRNNDREARRIPTFKLIDGYGAEYETSRKAWGVDGLITIADRLNPKVQKQGFIVFDVPTNRNYRLKVLGGYGAAEYALVKLAPLFKPD